MKYATAKCDLCGKPINDTDIFGLGKWIFDIDCYEKAVYRLSKFMDIVLLPDDEFNEWLEDDSQ